MIISKQANFAFVHIPKCAGTTVRNVIEKYDDCFRDAIEHLERDAKQPEIVKIPSYGFADSHHLPLQVLKDHLPLVLRALKGVESASVLRNPYSRVMSSFAEWTKLYRRQPIQELSPQTLVGLVRQIGSQVREHLKANSVLPYQLIHFQPQSTFVEIEGQRVVRNLFAMDDLATFEEFIIAHFADNGIALERFIKDKANVSIVHRSAITRSIFESHRTLVNAVKRVTPEMLRTMVHRLVYTESNSKLAEFAESQEVKTFVELCYQRDLEIWEEARG